MKIPKCPKTVSGEHSWKQKITSMPIRHSDQYPYGVVCENVKGLPYCEHCGLIDDTKEEKE